MEISIHKNNIQEAATRIWNFAKGEKVWAFYGEMGAGKTTIIKALCAFLEVREPVSSPTFSIINEYQSPIAGTLCHMDLYRLKDEQEAVQAGVEDCIYSGNYCFIEWPEKAPGLLPHSFAEIKLEFIRENERSISVKIHH
ncbi:MAG: tRNA (adenosine(37)-N6)-threonylcarbamoyltransferase complex ATPase subunit type 1 TsaE [Bacteroidetes bacterium]|nr:tRNA (adenosine(37)-N6)-threonylcarbamoyltransferase complex ATPase subunit type 1 TsaE [Bacteroidota bacterium]